MDKELAPGAPHSCLSATLLQLGLSLPAGTALDPAILQLLKQTRLIFPDSKITIFTFSKYWSEFDLFDYFDDVAAVSDGNSEGLKNIIIERDLDIFIETVTGGPGKAAGENSAWGSAIAGLQYNKSLEISSKTTGNIYVKDRGTPFAIDAAIAALGSIEVGGGELHRDILREIDAQAPLDCIVLNPWPADGPQDGTWTAAVWADIGRRLVDAGFDLIIAGPAECHPAAAALRADIGAANVQLAVGRASLRQTAILLGRARGAVTAPGFTARLAALAGTPLVVLDSTVAAPQADPGAQAAAAVASLQSLLASGPVGA